MDRLCDAWRLHTIHLSFPNGAEIHVRERQTSIDMASHEARYVVIYACSKSNEQSLRYSHFLGSSTERITLYLKPPPHYVGQPVLCCPRLSLRLANKITCAKNIPSVTDLICTYRMNNSSHHKCFLPARERNRIIKRRSVHVKNTTNSLLTNFPQNGSDKRILARPRHMHELTNNT